MPQLILTSDPGSVDLAMEELHRNSTDTVVDAELAEGVLLAGCLEGFWGLAESWRRDPPIFVRHINPVDVSVQLVGADTDISAIVDVIEHEVTGLVDPELPFSVQTRILADLPYRPYDINKAVSDRLLELSGAPLNVRNPVQILSVVCARAKMPPAPLPGGHSPLDPARSGQQPGGGTQIHAYAGLSLADYNLSDWAGGERRFAREKGQISRAEFKLLEVFDVFGIELPPRGRALDLGAAPGGWTRVLRQHEQYVTAVDPAALDPRLERDRDVRHLRMTAEAYWADEPDEYDLIVNDMRMDARDSARLMVAFARHLYPHGMAIMTFKLPEEGRRSVLDHAFNILQRAYKVVAARQLFHNRSEITVWLRKR